MTDDANVVSLLDRQLQRHLELYGTSAAETAAKHDQALADLFYRSGWTIEELARKQNRPSQWIAPRLRFGCFLNFMPMGINAKLPSVTLTQRKFDQLWKATDEIGGNERQRFIAIMKLIRERKP